MGAKYQALKGMDDLLPGEIEKWQWLEARARVFFESRGFKEIRTPILEYTELFSRSVGAASDIVHKEMFSFEDRGERNISLRPEMTASVARAVIEHGLLKTNKSLRLYYIGPMFRAERPQAGRKRQFHQIGIEMINEFPRPNPLPLGGRGQRSSPRRGKGEGEDFSTDFEVIFLLCAFLDYVGLKDFRLRLNDLGDVSRQEQIAKKLKQYFSQQKTKLCSDCQYRLDKNVLRIFDCKNESCQPVIDKVSWDEIAPLSKSFEALIKALDPAGYPFEIKRRLVRGLDYYNGTVFEVAAAGLGAQDALAGGGRYDRLYADLGGDSTPCTGFSIGIERLLAVLENAKPSLSEKIRSRRVYLASLEDNQKIRVHAYEKSLHLRKTRDIQVETLLGETSLSKHLKKANQLGIRFVLILGSTEFEKGVWTVKDMEKKTQQEIRDEELGSRLEEALGS